MSLHLLQIIAPFEPRTSHKNSSSHFRWKSFSTEAGFVFFVCTSAVYLLGLSFVIDFRFNVPVFKPWNNERCCSFRLAAYTFYDGTKQRMVAKFRLGSILELSQSARGILGSVNTRPYFGKVLKGRQRNIIMLNVVVEAAAESISCFVRLIILSHELAGNFRDEPFTFIIP